MESLLEWFDFNWWTIKTLNSQSESTQLAKAKFLKQQRQYSYHYRKTETLNTHTHFWIWAKSYFYLLLKLLLLLQQKQNQQTKYLSFWKCNKVMWTLLLLHFYGILSLFSESDMVTIVWGKTQHEHSAKHLNVQHKLESQTFWC